MNNQTVGGADAHGIAAVEGLALWWPWLMLVIGALALFIIGGGLAFRSPSLRNNMPLLRRSRGGRDDDDSSAGGAPVVPTSLRRLSRKRYTIVSNIHLAQDGATVRLDHVVVSRHGIFVVKTDHHDGTVSGEPGDEKWVRRSGRQQAEFPNPIRQCEAGVSALAKFLDLPEEIFYPIVFFTQKPAFASAVPLNVLNSRVGSHIARHRAVILQAERRDQVLKVLNLLGTATADYKPMAGPGNDRSTRRAGGGASGVA